MSLLADTENHINSLLPYNSVVPDIEHNSVNVYNRIILDTVVLFACRLKFSVDAVIHDTSQGDVPFFVKQFFAGMNEEEAAGYIRLCEDAEKIRTQI